MSELIVEVCEILEINEHPNADRLEIATIKGWPIIVQKDLVKVGDPVVFFPPDSVLTEELADKLGIRQYLIPVKHDSDTRYRVRAARLRGVASYGTIDHEVPDGCKVGDDVTETYGVIKWEPQGNEARPHKQGKARPKTNFHRYKSIENLRNFRSVFTEGEPVVITEKLHGQNMRVGYLTMPYDPGTGIMGWFRWLYHGVVGRPNPEYRFRAGSHNVERPVFDAEGNYNDHAIALADRNVQLLLKALSEDTRDVILFGELIGCGVQDTTYGHKDGTRSYRMFDISIDGKYMDADVKKETFTHYNIPTVPILYEGPFSWELVENLTDGPTTMCPKKDAGPFKGREGIVVTTLKEPEIGRKIFKSVSADFLARKNPTDSH